MLSKVTVSYIKTSVEKVNFWQCSPYSWNKETARITFVETKARKYLWYFNILAQSAYELYVIAQCIRVNYFDDSATPQGKIYMQYTTVAYMIPVTLHLGIFCRQREMPEFINQFMDFCDCFTRKYHIPNETGKGWKNGCEKFTRLFLRTGEFICCINLFLLFRRPERSVLLSSLIPNAKDLKPWQLVPFAFIHSYLWWSMWANMYFIAFPMYAYVFPAIFIINQLRPNRDSLRGNELQTNPVEFAKVYRCLQILQIKGNYVYGIALPGHKLLFVLLAIRSIYSSVTMSGGVAILLSVVAILVMIYLRVTFKVLAQFFEASTEVLHAWKMSRQDKWFRRVLQSCPPIKMAIGSLYFVDRGMVFTLVDIIVNNTINLLLSNK